MSAQAASHHQAGTQHRSVTGGAAGRGLGAGTCASSALQPGPPREGPALLNSLVPEPRAGVARKGKEPPVLQMQGPSGQQSSLCTRGLSQHPLTLQPLRKRTGRVHGGPCPAEAATPGASQPRISWQNTQDSPAQPTQDSPAHRPVSSKLSDGR